MKNPVKKSHRSNVIDIIRGGAIIAMIFFHVCVMERIFYGYEVVPSPLFWIFGKMIAVTFVFVSGFVVAFGSTSDMRRVWVRTLKRSMIIGVFAGLITLGTYVWSYFFGVDVFIVWGILHFFALSGILIPLFVRMDDRWIAGISFICIMLGIFCYLIIVPIHGIAWLGLRS